MTEVSKRAEALTNAAEALNRASGATDSNMMMSLQYLADRWMQLANMLPHGDDLTGDTTGAPSPSMYSR